MDNLKNRWESSCLFKKKKVSFPKIKHIFNILKMHFLGVALKKYVSYKPKENFVGKL